MPSKIKTAGVTGSLLVAMAKRGGQMTSDHRGFPPASTFRPLRNRGLVTLRREGGLGRMRYSVWHLTPKGWDASGMTPPAATA